MFSSMYWWVKQMSLSWQETWLPQRSFTRSVIISCLWNPDMQPCLKQKGTPKTGWFWWDIPLGICQPQPEACSLTNLETTAQCSGCSPHISRHHRISTCQLLHCKTFRHPESNSGKWCPSLTSCSFMADGIDKGLLGWDSIESFLWGHCPSFFCCHSMVCERCESVLWRFVVSGLERRIFHCRTEVRAFGTEKLRDFRDFVPGIFNNWKLPPLPGRCWAPLYNSTFDEIRNVDPCRSM